MSRVFINDLHSHVGNEVTVKGWVSVRRDQGKMIFLDIRDFTGVVQGVCLPFNKDALEVGNLLRTEWVVEVTGNINKRPEKNIQDDKANGDIELEIKNITVLNEANTPTFDISTDGKEVGEDVRLSHRYLDLRRERMQENIRARDKIATLVREYLHAEKFVEIETPVLSNPTPEGARSYLVPFRKSPGEFYALPQSPQQYKQLLMASGFERYFQFAKCYRDEDGRGDRQPEFTQMDLEMSFTDREEMMQLNEQALIDIVTKLYPHKKIQTIPFPRMSYDEAMSKYGNDRPDIREDKNDPDLLAFLWVVDFPFFVKTADNDNPEALGEWTFSHNPFSRPIDEHMGNLRNKKDIGSIKTSQYDITLNGYEIGGGSIRNHSSDDLRCVLEILGYDESKIESNFGHMISAFKTGVPPHGGIAWGFDRLVMLLQNEPNIREVMAFPKNGEGRDLMVATPIAPGAKALNELKLKISL